MKHIKYLLYLLKFYISNLNKINNKKEKPVSYDEWDNCKKLLMIPITYLLNHDMCKKIYNELYLEITNDIYDILINDSSIMIILSNALANLGNNNITTTLLININNVDSYYKINNINKLISNSKYIIIKTDNYPVKIKSSNLF